VLGQHRSVQRHVAKPRLDEDILTAAIIALARRFGRYGYRKVADPLRRIGWQVNDKRVERIWRQEGLKIPQKQPKWSRLWLNSSCIRLRPQHPNHVWAHDFVMDRTCDGKAFRNLVAIDEYTRECLAIVVARKLNSQDVIETLADIMLERGVPEHIRSDNDQSSQPRQYVGGWADLEPPRCSSNPAAPGRTDTAKASTASSDLACSTLRSSNRSKKQRF